MADGTVESEIDVVGAAAEALTAEGEELPPAQRQLMRLWLVLIDGTVAPEQITEAWCAARAIQAVYNRLLTESYQDGLMAGINAATDEAKQDGYKAGWDQAVKDAVGRIGSPATTETDPLVPRDELPPC